MVSLNRKSLSGEFFKFLDLRIRWVLCVLLAVGEEAAVCKAALPVDAACRRSELAEQVAPTAT